MLNPTLLSEFMDRFYGYGSWDARLWFVGMEEGGGDSLDEIQRRLDAWDRTDELADLRTFHEAVIRKGKNWFSERPPIQRTWGKLIRAALIADGREAIPEQVRRYQRDELGRRGGATALIELLPLPSPSTSDWLYADAGISSIATREQYVQSIRPRRISTIQSRIAKYKPAAVIFYGITYREHWEAIVGARFERIDGQRYMEARGPSRFLLAPHPTATGVRNEDYDALGRTIRSR